MDDLDIVVYPEEQPLPHQRPPLASGNHYTWGNPHKNDVVVICSQNIISEVTSFSQTSANEVGGVLMGSAYRFEGQIFVHVSAFIQAPVFSGQQSGRTHFNFTPKTWTAIHQIRDRQYPKLKIVGWFHSHPGHGIFLSGEDLQIHQQHFDQSWHIALVFDPIRHEGNFFIWQDHQITPSAGFYEYSETTWAHPIMTWKNWSKDPSRNLPSSEQRTKPTPAAHHQDPHPQKNKEQTYPSNRKPLVPLIFFILLVFTFFLFFLYFSQQEMIRGQQERLFYAETEIRQLNLTQAIIITQINDSKATDGAFLNTLTWTEIIITATPSPTRTVTQTLTLAPTQTLTPQPSETLTQVLTMTASVTSTPTPQ